MIREIRVRNLAILPETTVEFEDRLNVLSGETGAGKSIVVDAMGLLAGERSSSEMVRTGEDSASIEGVIELPRTSPLWRLLKEHEIPHADGELILRRALSADGRGRAFVNDHPTTVAFLATLAPYWIDISGQHGSQMLLTEESHLNLIDAYAGTSMELSMYQEIYARVRDLKRRLMNLKTRREDALKQREYLTFRLKELGDAKLHPGEMEELEAQHGRLANVQQLTTLSVETEALLSGDGGAQEKFGQALSHLKSLHRTDASIQNLLSQAEEISTQIKDLSGVLSVYLRNLNLDPEDLDRINERLSRLQAIQRKYGSIEKAIVERSEVESLLALIEDSGMEEGELTRAIQADTAALIHAAAQLSKKRKSAAKTFATDVSQELRLLGMPQADLKLEFLPPSEEGAFTVETERFGPKGAEAARVLFAPNPGEGFRPLSKIVSGGELSRVLLAIKSVALAQSSVDGVTYLFDEVDVGIGGETAERVGIRMRALSEGRQVLCVTHLAQIACYATSHIKVEKRQRAGRTVADVERLSEESRMEELARMIGGIKVTPKTREYATELLERGKASKQKGSLTRA